MGIEQKLTYWAIFSVAVALVPLLVNAIVLMLHNQYSGIQSIINRGQLLLISAGLCASSAGILIGSGNKLLTYKIVAGGAVFIAFSISTLVYAHINSAQQTGGQVNNSVVVNSSMALFAISIAACVACMILAEY